MATSFCWSPMLPQPPFKLIGGSVTSPRWRSISGFSVCSIARSSIKWPSLGRLGACVLAVGLWRSQLRDFSFLFAVLIDRVVDGCLGHFLIVTLINVCCASVFCSGDWLHCFSSCCLAACLLTVDLVPRLPRNLVGCGFHCCLAACCQCAGFCESRKVHFLSFGRSVILHLVPRQPATS